MPYERIASHSLANVPWLPTSCYEGSRVVPLLGPPTSAQVEEVRRKIEAKRTAGQFYDFEDAWQEDAEEPPNGMEDMNPMEIMQLSMQRSFARMSSMGDQDRWQKATQQHVLDCFKSRRTKEQSTQAYDIKIRLKDLKPPVIRTVRVLANMPLHAFCDRVVITAFGWCRGLHAYAVHLPTAAYAGRRRPKVEKDVVFIPPNCGTVDIMHMGSVMPFRGQDCKISADKVLLCDVLRDKGDCVDMLYDMGDKLGLRLTLLTSHGADSPEFASVRDGKKAVLLAALHASIPENPGSSFHHAVRLHKLATNDRKSEEYRQAMESLAESPSIQFIQPPHSAVFDHTLVAPSYIQMRLDKAMAEVGGRSYGGPMAGGAGSMSFMGDGGSFFRTEGEVLGSDPDLPMQDEGEDCHCDNCKRAKGAEFIGPKAFCGLPRCDKALYDPNWCAGCRNAAYCGPECQRADWKEHKLACIKRSKA